MQNKEGLWEFRSARSISWLQKTGLMTMICVGIFSISNLFDWWFRAENIASLPFFLLLTAIFWWGIIRMVFLWISYLKIRKPTPIKAEEGLKVAIFTTSSPGEPLSMFEKTLEACSNIHYPHTTYLLDDTRDPRFKEVAKKYGAVWLELLDYPGAKAGKINEALKRTDEDFILVLDPDHIPFPNFLDEVLGYFRDAKVGFVQVAQAYYNQYRSFVAKGAAEQTYGFYGPTQMGMNGYNCSVAIGANCTFRREALESIGGHGIGLAEDLITSIRIHAKGWKSVYTPIIVSRGLVPEDFGSFCKQQLKWARGVHEMLFSELPKLWKKLSFFQILSYFSIGSYYATGVMTFLFILIPYLFLWLNWLPAHMNFAEFVLNWLPVALSGVSIYLYVQLWLCHPQQESGLHWRGMFLKFACWPVFLMGFVLSIFNKNIPYIPTAKQSVAGFSLFARPLIIHQIVFISTLIGVVIQRVYWTDEASLALTSMDIWGMVTFAFISYLMTFGGIYAAIKSRKLKIEEPWKGIECNAIVVDNSPLKIIQIRK
ncbi:MAG: glycosyltransferase [Cyclobacteriaceae bacterium]|nr:glycosyltransferase [Cyclobacteriaceae bacterium]